MVPRMLFDEPGLDDDDDEGYSSFVPSGARSPNPFKSQQEHRGISSPTRTRPAIDGPQAVGRSSPMMGFKPIVRANSFEADPVEMHSYAGQMNAQDIQHHLRLAATSVNGGYDPEPMIKACIKVFTTHVHPTYAMPWLRGEETRSTGSGFAAHLPPLQPGDTLHRDATAAAAQGRIIVTNAHVVENHSLIQVRRAGAAEKYVARVVCIGHDVDLALLSVEDDEFWLGMPLVPIKTGIPRLASEVVAVGFPVGGDDVSATRGVVSRILVGGLTDNLCVQIDAAINPGNSGGPVFDSMGMLVGVAFSGLTHANNIGYIIPLPVLHTFLQNFRRHGSYTGKCSDCFEIQSMESSTMRQRFGLVGASGVMLSRIPPESAVHGVLQVRDILLEVDGVPIANDGTIQLPNTQDLVRVTFSYLVYRAPRDHPVTMTVLREKERHEFVVPARPQPELLLACKQPLPKPAYLVVGGLVFVPLMSVYESLIPRRKLDAVLRKPAFDGQQVVLLLMVLRAEVNIGYEELTGQVATLNDEPVQSLRWMLEKVERRTEGSHVFRLETGETIVLPVATCRASEEQIFRTHCIPHRASADLRSG